MLVIKIYIKFLLNLVVFAVWIIYIESVILKIIPLCKGNGCYTTLGDCYTLFIWCSSLRVVLLRNPKILFFTLIIIESRAAIFIYRCVVIKNSEPRRNRLGSEFFIGHAWRYISTDLPYIVKS